MRRFYSVAAVPLLFAIAAAQTTPAAATGAASGNPKVRAITAFVQMERANRDRVLDDALALLRRAKSLFEAAHYEVQSIRITTQPFPEYTRGLSRSEALRFLRSLDERAAHDNFLLNVGPAMVRDSDDPAAAELLAEFLANAKIANASLIIAGDDGPHPNAMRAAARLIKYLENNSPHSQATFSFAATAMLPPYAPFYPGSYHLGGGRRFSIGFESANVVQEVFAARPGDAAERLTSELTRHARVAESIGERLEKETGWTYAGFDPTPAPLKDVSIGDAIEKFTGAPFGSSGTLAAARVITQAVRAVPVKQAGYSGLMVPVLEDARLAQRWSERRYGLDSLLAYSAVCGTGLDTVPLPGDITEEQITRILGDVAALAVKWGKPLSARLQPVAGKKAGDSTDYDDPYLVNAVLQPLP